ncbi:hypothetical protein KC19_12G109600 [Ceratodon purpureus]|uniref:Uncharacterized protein n=1 Tax=Ceratodon purpureus TaxID=3225 RepID=A0A8T0G5V1_CERPU|nr:hypothetical protein KC19_12G109600 [Ceratodon purpureus]
MPVVVLDHGIKDGVDITTNDSFQEECCTTAILLFLVVLSTFSSQGTALQTYKIIRLLWLDLHWPTRIFLPCLLPEYHDDERE